MAITEGGNSTRYDSGDVFYSEVTLNSSTWTDVVLASGFIRLSYELTNNDPENISIFVRELPGSDISTIEAERLAPGGIGRSEKDETYQGIVSAKSVSGTPTLQTKEIRRIS